VFRQDPLLKVGLIAMTVALVLAIFAVVVNIAVRSDPEQAIASEKVTTTEAPVEPRTIGAEPFGPWVEKAQPVPTAGVSKTESNPGPSGSEPNPEFKLTRGANAKVQSESHPQARQGRESKRDPETQVGVGSRPGPETYARAGSNGQPGAGQRTLPAGEDSDWHMPTQQEREDANNPRHYILPAGAIMGLTIDSIGIYNAPVFDSDSQWALAKGVAHVPETSLPWSPTPQRNVYLAGHRMGYRGTWSRMIFYNLDKVTEGDKVVLKDRQDHKYEYRVSETFLAEPTDSWVMGQVRGRDMLTLQTCTPIPTFEKRLIVRALRVSSQP
jgi:sortase A